MKYKYIGDGAGVPGLPHEITDEEAQAQGLSDLLMAAVANGSYQAVESTSPPRNRSTGIHYEKREDKDKE